MQIHFQDHPDEIKLVAVRRIENQELTDQHLQDIKIETLKEWSHVYDCVG